MEWLVYEDERVASRRANRNEGEAKWRTVQIVLSLYVQSGSGRGAGKSSNSSGDPSVPAASRFKSQSLGQRLKIQCPGAPM